MRTYAQDNEFLNVLDKESSVELLKKPIPDSENEDYKDLENVVRQVDYLPLGILAAARFIRNDSLSAEDFLNTYSNNDLVQDADVHIHLGNRVGTGIRKTRNKGKDFLFLLTFLDTDKIQEGLLAEGAQKADLPVLQFLSGTKSFNMCRTLVTRSSLVSRNKETRQIWMHRLVKDNCHFRMSTAERRNAFQAAVYLLIVALPDREVHDRWNLALWPNVHEQLAHVVSLNRYFLASRSDESFHLPLQADSYFARLLFSAGWLLYEQGAFQDAFRMAGVAEECCLAHPEDNLDSLLSDIYALKASLDSETNQPESALCNYRSSASCFASACQKGLITRPDVRHAGGVASVGQGLQSLNRSEEAEPYYRRALDIWKEKDLPETPVTIQLGLGLYLRYRGKFEKAIEVAEEVIEY
ncbi:uncharacterized protein BDR25DRAFT_319968 [Lindgomyces ingoldianus]|uniref:Uncharacterized protein n=1 Tax=Lindgomyces ingoldianus TaxID=673940 RepID=A0ACB6QBB5_9PLEO|nr:uncharacterized protein BDR25DRAFT_319968 [Lindgomyces ingoldianus]KAF2463446.1 hypothetical protein BDR25DRAFT_319968 [Lindgomyces ingoldianus]